MIPMPPPAASSRKLLDLGQHHLAKLEEAAASTIELQGLAASFREAEETLRARMEARERAGRALDAAFHVRDEADRLLDQAVLDLSLSLLKASGSKRDDPRYARIFPNGGAAVTDLAIEREVGAVALLEYTLEAAKEPLGLEFGPVLRARREALQAAIGAVGAAAQAEASCFALERIGQLEWRRHYRKDADELGRLLEDASRFFKEERKGRGAGGKPAADEEHEEAEEAAAQAQ